MRDAVKNQKFIEGLAEKAAVAEAMGRKEKADVLIDTAKEFGEMFGVSFEEGILPVFKRAFRAVGVLPEEKAETEKPEAKPEPEEFVLSDHLSGLLMRMADLEAAGDFENAKRIHARVMLIVDEDGRPGFEEFVLEKMSALSEDVV